jgi:outer membrane receptor for ferrienterochelin and colicins
MRKMGAKQVFILIFLTLVIQKSYCQHDTVLSLENVLVHATRTTKQAKFLASPLTIITKQQIAQTGSQRLIDVLQQQVGIQLADNPLGQSLQGYPNPFGSGVQFLGLDAAYTQILVDGEPLTGRNAGVLNLNRIAVNNISQIEIIKGPATSLYGSDALAGVINIVTEKPTKNNSKAQLHYGTNNTVAATLQNQFVSKNICVASLLNAYRSGGYDLQDDIYGQTIDPNKNYSAAFKIHIPLSKKWELQQNLRGFYQIQNNNYLANLGTQVAPVKGNTTEVDWSSNTQAIYTANKKLKLINRFYATSYRNNAEVFSSIDDKLFDKTFLTQLYLKPEMQVEIGEKHKLIAGTGGIFQQIQSSRYQNKQNINSYYTFAQKDWQLLQQLLLTTGARLDKQQGFATQFSPKLAMLFNASKHVQITASVGTGFKAPDFRQQFLNFANGSVGYSLIGANELGSALNTMQQQGTIAPTANIKAFANQTLVPEQSIGYHFAVKTQSLKKVKAEVNLFRNDIKNLIETFILPFTKTNGQSIYSYVNAGTVYTHGADVNASATIKQNFSISAGYQYLEAKDKAIVDKIKNKGIVSRDPQTFASSYTTLKNYGGLFNRSKHSGNLQLAYNNKKLDLNISTRVTYRGRFGFSDVNGNAILDDDREYAKGYFLANFSVQKKINKKLHIQVGLDNAFDTTNPTQLPQLFGRKFFTNINYNF